MKKVIYTGNFSSNWGYFHGVQPWHIRSMYHQLAYAEKHGADYKVIDNSNERMQSIYSLYREISGGVADSWTLATLVTYAAIQEFSNSEYDQMCWIDIDLFIKKPDIDLFSYYDPGHLCLYHYYADSRYGDGLSQRFFSNFVGVEHKKYVQAGFIILDRQAAYDILNALNHLKIKVENKEYAKTLWSYYHELRDTKMARDMPVKFMCDECLLSACISTGKIKLQFPHDDLYSYITNGQNYDRSKDCFSVHFTAGGKYLINELF